MWGGGLALAANHHLRLGPVECEAVGLGVVHHDVDQTLQFLLLLLVILCHDRDRRVVRVAAVPVALPDLGLETWSRYSTGPNKDPCLTPYSTSTTSDTWLS
jgi:hypothetical protein